MTAPEPGSTEVTSCQSWLLVEKEKKKRSERGEPAFYAGPLKGLQLRFERSGRQFSHDALFGGQWRPSRFGSIRYIPIAMTPVWPGTPSGEAVSDGVHWLVHWVCASNLGMAFKSGQSGIVLRIKNRCLARPCWLPARHPRLRHWNGDIAFPKHGRG